MADKNELRNDIKVITTDFLDIEEEILIKLEHQLTEAFDQSLAVMERVIVKLEKLPPKTLVNDGRVEKILVEAEKVFHREWLSRSLGILRNEYQQSQYRGVLQSQAYMKVIPTEGEEANGK